MLHDSRLLQPFKNDIFAVYYCCEHSRFVTLPLYDVTELDWTEQRVDIKAF